MTTQDCLRALANHLDTHPDLPPTGRASAHHSGIDVHVFPGSSTALLAWAHTLTDATVRIYRPSGAVHAEVTGTLGGHPARVWSDIEPILLPTSTHDLHLALAEFARQVELIPTIQAAITQAEADARRGLHPATADQR